MSAEGRRKMSIRKDDIVVVTSGAEKGKKGRVIEAIPSRDRVVVEKVNVIKRHMRPNPRQREGGIVEREAPIHVSAVGIFCPKCDRPVKISHKRLSDGRKVRICRKCGEMFDIV